MNVFLDHAVAASYDDYYHTEFGIRVDAIEKELVTALISDAPRGHMLDLGCGTGHWTEFFLHQGFTVTGIDHSAAMLEVARSKAIDAEFIQANAEDLPLADESQSFIASITMLEFVNNPGKIIREMHRVLRPNGYLLIGGLNADSVLGKNKEKDDVFKYANMYTPDSLKMAFQSFAIQQITQGVYLDPEFSLRDGKKNIKGIVPVFIGMLMQKSNL